MTPDRWTTSGSVEFVQHKGFDAIELKPGNGAMKVKTGAAVLNGLIFRNGTIEFDAEPTGSMGGGLGFRRRDDDTYEGFYLRAQPHCDEAWDCSQYAPQVRGVLLWDRFPQYQVPAPIRVNEWNHMKLVVSGQKMNIYINGDTNPALRVGHLEVDSEEGEIVVQGSGFIANVSVTPDAVEGLTAEPDADPTAADPRYVRNWMLSPYAELGVDKEPSFADMPTASAAWQPLAAERGETREMWIFVNGKLIYADKNLYQPPSARKVPNGRASFENGSFYFPLNAGNNEGAVALDSNFYGLLPLFVLTIWSERPQLVFLDVQMPEMDGLGVIEDVGIANMPLTVFVSAYDQHAVNAFEANALDYLLKPFSEERFEATITRVKNRLNEISLQEFGQKIRNLAATGQSFGAAAQGGGHETVAQEPFARRLAAEPFDRLVDKSGGTTGLVRVADIDWIEPAGIYVNLHIGGKELLYRSLLHELAERLDPRRFVRVHRSAIVNIESILHLKPASHGEFEVVLKNGSRSRVIRPIERRWRSGSDSRSEAYGHVQSLCCHSRLPWSSEIPRTERFSA